MQASPPDDPLHGLAREHPRLILTREKLDELRRRIDAEPKMRERWEAVRSRADAILGEPAATYDIPDGKRLLMTSRKVLERMQTLGLTALLADEPKYAERAWRDLEAAAAFPDWNPSHFLDTAELAHAFGVGFDWLHPFWDAHQQDVIADAIVRHAFKPALPLYDRGGGWPRGDNNWNVVCHGGLGVAALAIAEREPELARRVLREAAAGMPFCLRHFAPDGGWPEGGAYWVYTCEYLSVFLASCKSALSHDFGLGDGAGLAETVLFPVHLSSPAGGSFNFSDSGSSWIDSWAILYFAHRFGHPAAAEHQTRTRKVEALDLIWAPTDAQRAPLATLPLDYHCRGVECVTLRSAWDDPRAAFLGIQCGRNTAGHNRLDKGAFVYESRGIRWFLTLDKDDYNQRDFFGKLRYHYYRNRAEGHNAIVLDGFRNEASAGDQAPGAGGRITTFDSRNDGASVAMDLTDVYGGVANVTRRVDFRRDGRVTLTDEVVGEGGAPAGMWWFAHTRQRATIEEDGRAAVLSHEGGETLRVELVEPADARFELMDAKPLPTSPNPEGQNPNDGTMGEGIRRRINGSPVYLEKPDRKLAARKLAIHVRGNPTARIAVRWGP